MDCYHCEVCDMINNPKSKSRHFESNTQKNINKQKHINFTIDYPNIDDIDKIFYTYVN